MKVPGLYQKRGYYYYQPPQTKLHRQPAIALRTKVFSEAVARMAEIKNAQRFTTVSSPMASLVEEWLRVKAASRDHRDRTTRTAKPAMRRLLDHFRCDPRSIDTPAVVRWKTEMFAAGLSRATVAGYMRYSQSFFSWLLEQGHIFRNPFTRDVFPESIPTRREHACTKEERDRLITNCQDPDLKAVLFLGFHAGLRRDEILNLRRSWLILDPASGRLTHLRILNVAASESSRGFAIKDGQPKVVPATTPLAAFLQEEYGLDRGGPVGDPYVVAPQFLPGRHLYRWDFKRRWRTYCKSQGLEWVTPHTMRHTFVSLLLSAPGEKRPSLSHIARWTGTSERVLEKSYAHLFDDPEMINAAN